MPLPRPLRASFLCLATALVVLTLAPTAHAFVRGDASGDGAVALSDAILVLDHLFVSGAALPCEDGADVDDDGIIDISDPVAALAFLFVPGSRPPAFPYPSDGIDPTADDLGDCTQPPIVGLDFKIIDRGTATKLAPMTVVIRDPLRWEALWRTHIPQNTPPTPRIDFDGSVVVVIVREFPTQDHRLTVDRVVLTPDKLLVLTTEGAPLGDCQPDPQASQPFAFIATRAVDQDLSVEVTVVDTCP